MTSMVAARWTRCPAGLARLARSGRRIGHSWGMPDHDAVPGVTPQPRNPHRRYPILAVCLGNICRSPTAEVVLRAELTVAGLTSAVEVESAGTGDWHLGMAMDQGARGELAERGYDGSRHRARQLDGSNVRSSRIR